MTARRTRPRSPRRFDRLQRPVQGRGRLATTCRLCARSRGRLGPLRAAGASSTWAAARAVRRAPAEAPGPRSSGSTSRPRCSPRRPGLDRVRGSARRLPFADGGFDAVVAVEVFEHLAGASTTALARGPPGAPARGACWRSSTRTRRRSNADRPWLPSLVGQVDRRASRAVDVPGRRPGPRALVLARTGFARRLGRRFDDVRVEHLLSPERGGPAALPRVPTARLMTLWTAPRAGRSRDDSASSPPTLPALPLLLWETPPGLELILAQEGVAASQGPRPAPAGLPRRAGSCSTTAAGSPRRRSAPRSTPEHVADRRRRCSAASERGRPVPGARRHEGRAATWQRRRLRRSTERVARVAQGRRSAAG